MVWIDDEREDRTRTLRMLVSPLIAMIVACAVSLVGPGPTAGAATASAGRDLVAGAQTANAYEHELSVKQALSDLVAGAQTVNAYEHAHARRTSS